MMDRAQFVVACATAVEANAARRELTGIGVRVVETGVALCSGDENLGDAVISCGLAGGLRRGVPTGTVVVPHEVTRPDGSSLRCDPAFGEALALAAAQLGLTVLRDPLLTSGDLVRGSERERFARMGYAAVDMETGLLSAARVAAVRVVLDTPERELSEDWMSPFRAMIKPRNWGQLIWLAREAPACARRAARVVAVACSAA